MKIKQIKEIRPEEVEVEWENGEFETFKGQPAKTLWQMTAMKVGDRYCINNGYYLDTEVVAVTAEGVEFNCVGLIKYEDCKSYTFSLTFEGSKKQTTAKERVEQELADLEERYEKLDNFVGNARYMELPYAQKYLLVKQLAVMEEYEHILKARLDCWKD